MVWHGLASYKRMGWQLIDGNTQDIKIFCITNYE